MEPAGCQARLASSGGLPTGPGWAQPMGMRDCFRDQSGAAPCGMEHAHTVLSRASREAELHVCARCELPRCPRWRPSRDGGAGGGSALPCGDSSKGLGYLVLRLVWVGGRLPCSAGVSSPLASWWSCCRSPLAAPASPSSLCCLEKGVPAALPPHPPPGRLELGW